MNSNLNQSDASMVTNQSITVKVQKPVLGLFQPFQFTLSPSVGQDEATITILPLLCSPNLSSQTTAQNLMKRLCTKENVWIMSKHTVSGFFIKYIDGTIGADKTSKLPSSVNIAKSMMNDGKVCSMLETTKCVGRYTSIDDKCIDEFSKLLCKIEDEVGDKKMSIERGAGSREEVGLKPLVLRFDKIVQKIISESDNISDPYTKIANCLHKLLPQDFALKDMCHPCGIFQNNGYLRTAILVQGLCSVRIILKGLNDIHECVAKSLKDFGVDVSHTPAKTNQQFPIYSSGTATAELVSDSISLTIHEHGTVEFLNELKLSTFKSLGDIVDNINPEIYKNSFATAIDEYEEELTFDVRSQDSRKAQKLDPNFVVQKLFEKKALVACSSLEVLCGHQMLQQIMYIFYDVMQDAGSFALLKEKIDDYVSQDDNASAANEFLDTSAKPPSSTTKDHLLLTSLYCLSRSTATPNGIQFTKVMEAYDVKAFDRFGLWRQDYNEKHVFTTPYGGDDTTIQQPLLENRILHQDFKFFSKAYKSVLNTPNDSRVEEINMGLLSFLPRFCSRAKDREKVKKISIELKEKGFQEDLFLNAMNVLYNGCLHTFWTWCGQQESSLFTRERNRLIEMRVKIETRNKKPEEQLDLPSELDLKHAFKLIVGMKFILKLPHWLLDIFKDKEIKEQYSKFQAHVSVANKTETIFKKSTKSWHFTANDFRTKFNEVELCSYAHLQMLIAVLCAFKACLSMKKKPRQGDPICAALKSKFLEFVEAVMLYDEKVSDQTNPLSLFLNTFMESAADIIENRKNDFDEKKGMAIMNEFAILKKKKTSDIVTQQQTQQQTEKKELVNSSRKEESSSRRTATEFHIDEYEALILHHKTLGTDNESNDTEEYTKGYNAAMTDMKNATRVCMNENDSPIQIHNDDLRKRNGLNKRKAEPSKNGEKKGKGGDGNPVLTNASSGFMDIGNGSGSQSSNSKGSSSETEDNNCDASARAIALTLMTAAAKKATAKGHS
eukprot:scaffold11849_cov1149-Chaetoceros_neogracile.AAC.3